MKIGFVYLRGELGMSIRIKAVRRFLIESGHSVKDIELRAYSSPKSNTISESLRYWLSPVMLKALVRKTYLGRDFSVFKEISLLRHIEQLKKAFEYHYQEVLTASHGVDILHAETQIPAFICSRIKEEKNIPCVFDMHGLLVEEMKQRGVSKELINFWDAVERRAITHADHVIVVSQGMKEFVNEYFRKSFVHITVIPNGSRLYKKKAHHQTPMKVIYGGIFDHYERVLDFVKTAEILSGGEHQFFLMGEGLLRNEILDYINKRNVNIVYLGKKSREQSLEIFCNMQIGVAPSTKDTVRRTASPIKVLDYAACGLPIVTVNAGEWSDMVKRHDCGIVVENSDPKELAGAIKKLMDRQIWEKMSENGRSMIYKDCNWDKVLQSLLGIYSEERSFMKGCYA